MIEPGQKEKKKSQKLPLPIPMKEKIPNGSHEKKRGNTESIIPIISSRAFMTRVV